MAVDAAGNDLEAVFVPVTGFLALAAYGTAAPTEAEMNNPSFELPGAGTTWRKLGLIAKDGGFEWESGPDGDPDEYFQSGYSQPTGNAKCNLKVKAAQFDALVREITSGQVPNGNNYITVDAGGHSTQYCSFVAEVDKRGRVRRRFNANTTVASFTEDKSERGVSKGTEITFKWDRHAAHGNNHYAETLIPVDSTPAPYIASILPSGAAVGADVLVRGNNLGTSGSDISAFTIDGVAVAVKTWIDSSNIVATIPAAVSGAANAILTTTSGGASNTYAYTAA